jgi:5-methylcytosine-specific restriction endonuclease McrA
METKTCSKCKQEKPATTEFFRVDNRVRSGLEASCKACGSAYAHAKWIADVEASRAYSRENHRRNKEQESARSKVRYVENREKILAHKKEWYEANRERENAVSRAWKAAHPEQVKANYRAWREAHKEERSAFMKRWVKEHPELNSAYARNHHARKKGNGGSHTAEDIQAQLLRQKGKCFWCKKKVDKYHVDHVIPLSKGGSNGPENLVIACPFCNLSKKDKHPMEFAGVML